MGCDIHIVLERKVEGRWIGLHGMNYIPEQAVECLNYPTGPVDVAFIRWKLNTRDYNFFWALAGVRGPYESIPEGEQRGLPEDCSELSRFLIGEDHDLHSHSWLTVAELLPIIEAVKLGGAVPNAVANKLLGLPRSNVCFDWIGNYEPNEYDQLRVVFAFDN